MKKTNLTEYEHLFKQNKWEKHLPNLYKCIIEGKPVDELIECIKKLQKSKMDSNDSKPSPILRYKDADISYNKQTNEFVVETQESAKIGVSCPSGEQGYLENGRAGCKKVGNFISEFLKKEKLNERK